MMSPATKILASAALGITVLAAGCSETMNLSTTRSYDQTFLSNYKDLKPRDKDFIYVSPEARVMLAAARGVLIDQPEIHIAADSPWKGAKPADLTTIAEVMRTNLSDALKKQGYNVVTEPGQNILLVRTAFTDMYLEQKPRNALEYTPIGFVVGTGISAMQSIMQKYDILAITFQAEVSDSGNRALIAELVAPRGGNKLVITFDQYKNQMQTWGARLACNLGNAKAPLAQQVDCYVGDAG
jgi:hypothetical protein